MKRYVKNKLLSCFIAAVTVVSATVCAVFSLKSNALNVHAYSSLSNVTTIGNIYNGKINDKAVFDKVNLDILAQQVGYSDMGDMVDKVGKETQGKGVKTSADFGDTVIKFGSYTFKGTSYELSWIPSYVSNTAQGPILTLWLANTESSNGTVSEQEMSAYSDGTYGDSANSNGIYSNTYDGSYIRNYVLNGRTDYTTSWGVGTGITPTAASEMTKFLQFTGSGELADYIVTPRQVNWQTTAAYQKNDPEWNAGGGNGTKENYTDNWLDDKLWLPSIYEVFDSSLNADSTSTTFTENGGLWATGSALERDKRSNSYWSWLRSGFSTNFNVAYYVYQDGTFSSYYVSAIGAVRPALHLNLAKALNNSHTHNWDVNDETDAEGWKVTAATCVSAGSQERVCKETNCPLEDSKEIKIIPIDTNAHNLSKQESVAATCETAGTNEHYRCSDCNGLFWDSAGKSACTAADVVAAALNHVYTDKVVAPTCSERGYTEHTCTREGCGNTYMDTYVDQLSHTWDGGTVEKAETCTAVGIKVFTCTECGNKKTTQIDALGHTEVVDVGIDATCTTAGRTEGKHCSVCNEVLTVQQVIPELGHTEVIDEGIDATCTTAGKTEGKHCSSCNEVIIAQQEVPALGHDYQWKTTIPPTAEKEGLKEELCSRCEDKRAEQAIAKLISDVGGNGNVSDLPAGNDYKLEISIKESQSKYESLSGVSKGYLVELFIVDGENLTTYDKDKVNLTLLIPEIMRDGFDLYKIVDGLKPQLVNSEEYEVNNGVLKITTTLPGEFIFNNPKAEPENAGVKWWIWLIVVIAVVAVVILIVVLIVAKKRKNGGDNTPVTTVIKEGVAYDDSELKSKIDELLSRKGSSFEQPLSDDEMRSFFTDEELISMVQEGRISQEDCNRIVGGRK